MRLKLDTAMTCVWLKILQKDHDMTIPYTDRYSKSSWWGILSRKSVSHGHDLRIIEPKNVPTHLEVKAEFKYLADSSQFFEGSEQRT